MKRFLLAVMALSIVAPSMAHTHETMAVRTGNLALNRPADAQRLLRRLDKAALDVCGASHVSVRELQRAVRATDCYAQAMHEAVNAVGAPLVADLHRQRAPAYAAR